MGQHMIANIRIRLAALIGAIVAWFRNPTVAPESAYLINEATEPAPTEPAPTRHGARATASDDETVVWHFKRDILDRLDEYMACMRRVKQRDPDSYALFSRVGLSVPTGLLDPQYEPHLAMMRDAPRLAFGGVLIAHPRQRDEQKYIYPSFVYFRKLKHPPRVALAPGCSVYELIAIYDDRDYESHWRSNGAFPCLCYVAVSADGSVALLRQLVMTKHRITPMRTRRGRTRKGETFSMQSAEWRYPTWIVEIARSHSETPEDVASWFFRCALCTTLESQSRVVVRVKRGGTTAAFGIDATRGKYFFADRDTMALAVDGKRQRIFHSVIAHDRHLANDRIVRVRYHYRGLRHFDWNGYSVGIVFPPRNTLLRFDSPAVSVDNLQDERAAIAEHGPLVDSREAGKMFDNALSR